MNKKELYESIMSEIAVIVKSKIEEAQYYGQHMSYNPYTSYYNADAMVSNSLYGNAYSYNKENSYTVGTLGDRIKVTSLDKLFPNAIDNFNYEDVDNEQNWKCIFFYNEKDMWSKMEDDLIAKIRAVDT